MSLIKEKSQLTGLIRTMFINASSNLPDFEFAAENYLLPYIGQDLYDHAQELADDVTPLPADPTADQLNDQALLKHCRRVVAATGYLLELPLIHAKISDTGLHTANSESLQSAHRWEYEEVKEHLLNRGALAIESLLNFLFFHKEDYPEWTESDAYKEVSSLIFSTGADFTRYFTLHQPQRLFWELRPVIREVQDFFIIPSIGEAFFLGLKEEVSPDVKQKAAILLIKKAVAQLTIVKAIEKLSCKLTTKGFTVLLSAGNADASNAGDAGSKDNQLSLLYESCSRTGDDYIMQLKEYLNSNATSLVFPGYFNSSYYKALVNPADIQNPNSCRRIFGML